MGSVRVSIGYNYVNSGGGSVKVAVFVVRRCEINYGAQKTAAGLISNSGRLSASGTEACLRKRRRVRNLYPRTYVTPPHVARQPPPAPGRRLYYIACQIFLFSPNANTKKTATPQLFAPDIALTNSNPFKKTNIHPDNGNVYKTALGLFKMPLFERPAG